MTTTPTHTLSAPAQQLLDAIHANTACVGVIGLGYVGLPLAHALHHGGLRVLGFDVDHAKVRALADGVSYLKHLGNELVTDLQKSSRFEATSDFQRLGEADILIVCVPTPIGSHQEPDISYILQTAEAIGKTLRAGQLIVLESTTYPGTTRQDMMPAVFSASGARAETLQSGRDVFFAFSPEREDPGRKSHSTSSIPKLVGGVDAASTLLACAVYRKGITTVVPVETAEIAESAKLLENIFRAVNIAMVNEMKVVLSAMGIDIWEVIRAASTKPFGFMPFYPSIGVGGHCIPVDPLYLANAAKSVGAPTRFIDLADQVNQEMPGYFVARAEEKIGGLKDKKVLVVGVSYKPNVSDVRETPVETLIFGLKQKGAQVSWHDNLVKVWNGEESVALSSAFDLAIIATPHDYLDLTKLGNVPILNTRGSI